MILALVIWSVFSIPFPEMKAYVNGLAADGEVESFTADRYSGAQLKARLLSGFALLTAIILGFSSRRSRSKVNASTGLSGLREDWRKGRVKLFKHTSKTHLYAVGSIILVGAVLRATFLTSPIIYDEAFTYTYFAQQPVFVIMSDYSYPNNHILHTLLVKLSCAIFGVGLIPLRLPAFIAGVLCMPVLYLFVRSMFNRYIALMTLAMVAGAGGLIEYSALARGYSITWLCMLVSLQLMRHFISTNNTASALLLALVNAIGMWTVPTMIYMTVFVYVTGFLLLLSKYETTLKDRVQKMVLSLVTFVAFTGLLYSPVVIMNSIDQLIDHPTMGESVWEGGLTTAMDRFAEILVYWAHTTHPVVTFLGILAMIFTGFISSKYRVLFFATVIGIIPLVIAQGMIGPARIWNYILFVYCIGVAIALFYALKALQDRVFPGLHKRVRTIAASALLLALFAMLAMPTIPDRYNRFDDASLVAEVIKRNWSDGDVIMSDFPWKAAVRFHLLANDTGEKGMFEEARPGARTFIVVSPSSGQSLETVLAHFKLAPEALKESTVLMDKGKCELHSARFNQFINGRR